MEKTSIQKWKKSQEILKKKSKQIKSLSNSIRYVGIINEYGKTLTGILKSGISPLFTRNQVRDEFFAISSFMKLRTKTVTSIGKLNYILLNHQKVNSLIFQSEKITYYITFSKNVIPSKVLIKKINNIVLVNGKHNLGYKKYAPYDLIFISGSVNNIKSSLFDQLGENGRLIACKPHNQVILNGKVIIYTKTSGVISKQYLFDFK